MKRTSSFSVCTRTTHSFKALLDKIYLFYVRIVIKWMREIGGKKINKRVVSIQRKISQEKQIEQL